MRSSNTPVLRADRWAARVDNVILAAAAFAAVFLGLADIIFQPTELRGKELGIAVALLGIIAIHGILQGITTRNVQEVVGQIARTTEDLVSLDRSRRTFARAMGHYIEVQELKFRLRDKGNPAFGAVADRLLAPPFRILETLADGEVNVPENLIMTAFSIMIESYSDRFDAVSNDDLDFWHDNKTIAPRYISQNVAAIRRKMIVTRLFIFTERQICDDAERAKISQVVGYQMSLQIRWAIAIFEDIEPGLPSGPLDFALFDGGKAMSTFRREGERRFIATFATNGEIRRNDERIAHQRKLYDALLTEVWIASETFTENYLGFDDADRAAQLESDTKLHNRRARRARGKELDHSVFPFIVREETELLSKLDELAKTYETYRREKLAR